ncbi:MAG: hypothetical protein ACI89E_002326 [Planctomycetota bacterium]
MGNLYFSGSPTIDPLVGQRLISPPRWIAQPDAAPNLTWFAGYATIVAAEYHRRASEMELAKAA